MSGEILDALVRDGTDGRFTPREPMGDQAIYRLPVEKSPTNRPESFRSESPTVFRCKFLFPNALYANSAGWLPAVVWSVRLSCY